MRSDDALSAHPSGGEYGSPGRGASQGDSRDAALSRRLQDLAKKVNELVTQELGEPHLIGLVIQPYAESEGEVAEFQYISNAPRDFMHGALRELVRKWDGGAPSIPPHEKQ